MRGIHIKLFKIIKKYGVFYFLRLSPVGVTFLVAGQILEVKDFKSIVESLGMYFLTVLLGLILHGFGTLSIIFFICTRELPFKAIGKMSQVMITAFGTASRY